MRLFNLTLLYESVSCYRKLTVERSYISIRQAYVIMLL